MTIGRRKFLQGAVTTGLVSLTMPWVTRAATGPMRVGFLTVKTGPLASGGLQMEQGLTLYLKERNNVLAGRPVVLSRERGRVIELADGQRGMVTTHPSSILRMPDQKARHVAFASLVKDLKAAAKQAAA